MASGAGLGLRLRLNGFEGVAGRGPGGHGGMVEGAREAGEEGDKWCLGCRLETWGGWGSWRLGRADHVMLRGGGAARSWRG